MTYSIDWNLAGLRENPFIIGPPTNPKQAIWAGLKELKGELRVSSGKPKHRPQRK